MDQSLIVGMAEIKVLRVSAALEGDSFTVLKALGLGSCIGICAYDGVAHVAGMAHVVLPERPARGEDPRGKYADTAVPALLDEMVTFGASRERIIVAIAGGAQLFTFESQAPQMAIGARNAAGVIAALKQAQIPLLASDVGGNQGRTLRLSATSGNVTVKTIGQGERQLIDLAEARPAAVRRAA
jgi:chemotaxis protein CheD